MTVKTKWNELKMCVFALNVLTLWNFAVLTWNSRFDRMGFVRSPVSVIVGCDEDAIEAKIARRIIKFGSVGRWAHQTEHFTLSSKLWFSFFSDARIKIKQSPKFFSLLFRLFVLFFFFANLRRPNWRARKRCSDFYGNNFVCHCVY